MKCTHCGIKFLQSRADQAYCSAACRRAAFDAREAAAELLRRDDQFDRVMSSLPTTAPTTAERIAILDALADEVEAGTSTADLYCAADRRLMDLVVAELDESFNPSIDL